MKTKDTKQVLGTLLVAAVAAMASGAAFTAKAAPKAAAKASAKPEPGVLEVTSRGRWLSKPIAVEPGARYRMTFRARVEGGPTLENCAEAAEAFYDVQRVVRGLVWPRWEFRFRRADGEGSRGWGILYPYWNSVASSAWRDYVDVFYAPLDAATMQVVYSSDSTNATLYATEPVIVKDTGKVLNVNSDFSLGPLCHAGFAMAGYGSSVRMLPKPEGGGWFMRVASWCSMDPIPVVGGRRYKVSVRLRKDTFTGARDTVVFSAADGKPIKNAGGDVVAKRSTQGGEETFRAPKDAVKMEMQVNSADYEWIRVTEAPEENDKKEVAK